MSKQGSTVGGLMDTIATLLSLNLQYGVPVDAIVRKFEHMRFEPSGMTTNADIPFAKSPIDYVVRWMGMEFVPGYRAANSPQRDINAIEPPAPSLFGEPVEHVEKEVHHDKDAPESDVPDLRGHGGPSISTYGGPRQQLAAKPGNGHTNGHGNGHGADSPCSDSKVLLEDAVVRRQNASLAMNSLHLAKMMGDAPVCTCGSITVRNGSCYKCLNCGASLGCS